MVHCMSYVLALAFINTVLPIRAQIKSGEKRWYQLKDKKGFIRTKGGVLLEMDLVFNHVRHAILCPDIVKGE